MLYKKRCAYPRCKRKFETPSSTKKYCCPECRQKNHRKKIGIYISEIEEYNCVECGKKAVGFINGKSYCKEHYQEVFKKNRGTRGRKWQ